MTTKNTVIAGGLLVALVLGGVYLWRSGEGEETPQGQAQQVQAPLPPYKAEGVFAGTVVRMTKDGFAPKEVRVKKGETVVWLNEDKDPRWPASDLHPTHTIYPELDPQEPVMPGFAWNVVLSKPGTWKIHDHLKPYFVGTVTVEEN